MIVSETDKLEIEQLWRRFKVIPFQEGKLLIDFTNFQKQVLFPKGTNIAEVKDYFNRVYPSGLVALNQL